MVQQAHLTEITSGKQYIIAGYEDGPSEYAEKLFSMGFIEGTPIMLAPVKISDPLIFYIRGSRIALRKKEAFHVLVQEA